MALEATTIQDTLMQDLTGEEFARTLNEHNRRIQTAVEERNRQRQADREQVPSHFYFLTLDLADPASAPDIQLTASSTGPVPSPNLPSPAYRERLRRVGALALLTQIDQSVEIERFQSHVISRGLRFYTRSNVEAYLLQKAKAYLTKDGGKSAQSYGLSWRLAVEWTPLPKYTHPIPDPVLETIEGVAGEFDKAQFFISEVKEYPDPFLMVKLCDKEFIIERWDEPGYREPELVAEGSKPEVTL
jgi:hypothetical protein